MSRKLFNAVMILVMLTALPLTMGMAQAPVLADGPVRAIGSLSPHQQA